MKTWIEKHSIGLSLALVVAVMVMIFCFSAQTGNASGALSGQITNWIIKLALPDFDQLPLSEQEALRGSVGLVIRKAAHFSEYTLLGVSLLLHILQIGKRLPVSKPWLWAWGIGVAYAISDELHQGLVADRNPSAVDVLIDGSGVLFGIGALALCLWLRRRKIGR